MAMSAGRHDRYHRVTMYDGSRKQKESVHVLVCEAFHGPKPSPVHEVAHRDCNKRHNHKDNLRWATPKENRADERVLRRNPSGERNPTAKLTWAEVRIARRMWANGLSQADIAIGLNVTQAQISNIVRETQWKEIHA